METLYDISNFKSFAGGLDHPECVAWGRDGNVYAGGEAGEIYCISPQGKVELVANTGGFILGVTLDGDNNIYACDVAKNQVVKVTPDGKISIYSEGSAERKMLSPNYSVFDRFGNLYVTASGTAGENNSSLFCIKPGGETFMVSDELRETANGLALSPDGNNLYVVLTETCSVVKVALSNGRSYNVPGKVGHPEPVAQLDRAVPDGLAVDVQGNVYIGCYAPDIIYRVSPDGKLAILAEDWKRSTFASPANLAFGGPDWTTLYVANFARWDIAAGKMSIPGNPNNYPKF